MSLQESPLFLALERLFRWLETNAPTIAQGLQPGLTREQIEAQVQHLPFRLPEEIYQFYQWRNGGSVEIAVEGDSPYQAAIELLPPYRLLSLEEAIEEYPNFCGLYGDYELYEDRAADNYLYFPLLMDSLYYYVAKGDVESKATAAIFNANLFSKEPGGLSLEFNSLADMMGAIVECFETGVYSAEGNYIKRGFTGESQIWLKYHSQRDARAANVDRLLDNQGQSPSEQEWLSACMDLARTEPLRALLLMRQKFEETEVEYQQLSAILNGGTSSTLTQKVEALNAIGTLDDSRNKLFQHIQAIETIEATQYLFELFKYCDTAGYEATRYHIMQQLNQRLSDRNLVYEAGQQDPEMVDRIRQMLQQSPNDYAAQRLMERLENEHA